MEMATNKLEEFLNKYPEAKSTIQNEAAKLNENGVKLGHQANAVEQAKKENKLDEMIVAEGKNLAKNGAELKQDSYGPQVPPQKGMSQPDALPPKLNEELLPANKRDNAFTRAQNAPTTEKTPIPTKEMENER